MAEYPELERLFAHNKPFLNKIAQDDPDGIVRSRAESVISGALEAGVRGVNKLVNDSGGDCRKFKNLTHEVMVALYFQKRSANVSILGDCAFGPSPIYAPDLEIITIEGHEILVEVTCRSSSATEMHRLVREMIEENQFPFRISHALGLKLSSSALDLDAWNVQKEHDARDAQKETAQKIIELATCAFTKLSETQAASGLIIIRDLNQTAEITLGIGGDEAWAGMWERGEFIACFQFEPITADKGYASGSVTSAHILPDDELRSAFLRDIKRKALNRDKLPVEKRNLPFIVAYVSEEWELVPEIAHSILIGQTTWLSDTTIEEQKNRVSALRAKQPQPVQEAIEGAYQNRWGETLNAWGHGEEGFKAFDEDGLYLDAVHMPNFAWGRNLTGVFILRNNGRDLQWLPNPFSKDASTTSWLQS
jgi:hypothetical protein